jgi:hypothetical protein
MTFSPRERNILLFKFSCKNYIYLWYITWCFDVDIQYRTAKSR